MEPNISEHFCYKETSKIMWDEVQNRFGKQNNYAHIYQLREELTHNKQNQRPFSQLYSEMQKKWDELDILQPNTSDPNQIQERKEQERIFQLLANLDPSYEAFRSQILLKSSLPSIENVVSLIEQEESRRGAMGVPQAVSDERSEAQALATNYSRNPNFRGKGQATTVDKCSHYKQAGHKKEKCWFLHPHLRPAGWVDRGDAGRRERGESANKWDSGWEKKKRGDDRSFTTQAYKPSGSNNTKDHTLALEIPQPSGSSGSTCEDPMQTMFKQFSMWYSRQNSDGISLNSIKSNLHEQIILDSGATDHMFYNKRFLTNLEPINYDQYVIVANGVKVKINGKGDYNIFSTKINDILYVNTFSTNLLSINKLTQ
jgi:gag-polypeptide of LTR copia-type